MPAKEERRAKREGGRGTKARGIRRRVPCRAHIHPPSRAVRGPEREGRRDGDGMEGGQKETRGAAEQTHLQEQSPKRSLCWDDLAVSG